MSLYDTTFYKYRATRDFQVTATKRSESVWSAPNGNTGGALQTKSISLLIKTGDVFEFNPVVGCRTSSGGYKFQFPFSSAPIGVEIGYFAIKVDQSTPISITNLKVDKNGNQITSKGANWLVLIGIALGAGITISLIARYLYKRKTSKA